MPPLCAADAVGTQPIHAFFGKRPRDDDARAAQAAAREVAINSLSNAKKQAVLEEATGSRAEVLLDAVMPPSAALLDMDLNDYDDEEEPAAAPTPPAPRVPVAITFGMGCAHGASGCPSTCHGEAPVVEGCEEEAQATITATPAPLALPFPTHLPVLPKSTKGRAVGKYVSQGGPRNSYTPTVVYWDGKRATPTCWKGSCVHKPNFGCQGDARPTRCHGCKEENMVNIVTKMCHCGAHQPIFGCQGDARPTRCHGCKEDGMVDIKSKMCQCGTHHPSFGCQGDARPTRCHGCKDVGMVDIKSKMCQCGAHHPSFGCEGDARPTRCHGCKDAGMVNIVAKMCQCGAHQPNFGCEGDARPTRCRGCKEDGMVDIVSKMCQCGEGKARYEDVDGHKYSLCLSCAIAEGTHPERIVGASYEACRFFCMLSRMTNKHEDVPHVHWHRASGEWNEYREVEGLVPGRKIRPDGFLPDPSGATNGTVYLYHGNRWHGYPPGHPDHAGEQVFRSARTGIERRVMNADLYAKTEADTQAYLTVGYGVVDMWGHDFRDAEKHNGLLQSLLVRRAPLPACGTPRGDVLRPVPAALMRSSEP